MTDRTSSASQAPSTRTVEGLDSEARKLLADGEGLCVQGTTFPRSRTPDGQLDLMQGLAMIEAAYGLWLPIVSTDAQLKAADAKKKLVFWSAFYPNNSDKLKAHAREAAEMSWRTGDYLDSVRLRFGQTGWRRFTRIVAPKPAPWSNEFQGKLNDGRTHNENALQYLIHSRPRSAQKELELSDKVWRKALEAARQQRKMRDAINAVSFGESETMRLREHIELIKERLQAGPPKTRDEAREWARHRSFGIPFDNPSEVPL